MRFAILAYNPRYVKIQDITDLVTEIFKNHSCPTHAIQHSDENSAPVYCVEVVDTDSEKEEL